MVNKTIISQCAHVFCGNLIDANDLKYVGNFLNKKSEELIKLPDRKFIYFSKDGVTEISNDFWPIEKKSQVPNSISVDHNQFTKRVLLMKKQIMYGALGAVIVLLIAKNVPQVRAVLIG